ncbi:MAG: hypothetical protein ABEJ93_04385 [Candidatus Nanohalobium sp.]
MVSVSEVRRVLEPEDADVFSEAEGLVDKSDIPDEEVGNIHRSLGYVIEALEDGYFDPVVASEMWRDGEPRGEDIQDLVDERDSLKDLAEKLHDYSERIGVLNQVSYEARVLEEDIDLTEVEKKGEWVQDLRELYTKSLWLNLKDKNLSQVTDLEGLLDAYNLADSSLLDREDGEISEDQELGPPQATDELAEKFLRFLVHDYYERVHRSMPEQKDGEVQDTVQEESHQSFEEEIERLQVEDVPDTYEGPVEDLVEAGAKYAHETGSIQVSELRDLLADARSNVEDFEKKRDTSFPGKGLDTATDMYRAIEQVLESDDYDASDVFGAGGGNRAKLNRLKAGIEAAEVGVEVQSYTREVKV